MDLKIFGLIGFPLSHSYSADIFNSKFRSAGLNDHVYKLFPLSDIKEFQHLIQKNPEIRGLNVTIPYKKEIISFLDKISPEAKQIGAVNCIGFNKGKLTGHNTDCYGFEKAYIEVIKSAGTQALVLGNGGASKAVQYVLALHDIKHMVVSRNQLDASISWMQLTNEIINNHKVIINTTPLGMFPETKAFPTIPYKQITTEHTLIDLIYNPEKTSFLSLGEQQGCRIINGLPMLQLQAEKSWEIWASE